ncbi:MAG: aspartate aminotransferase [Gammaproteobacteria bacterium RIFCSPHIGHO2_12_FULL_35_23]|nr:MAG: aspartate aminotransferase [Gammaproteobacteria bacterium RIFCSPHIGHO2_12_FULL_35_23]
MSKFVAKRIQNLKPSATLTLSARVKALSAAGEKIVDLSLGEPDFNTPDYICEAAIAAIKAGNNKYTPVGGTLELKNAIISKLKRENNLSYTPTQIIASAGAKQALFNLFLAILNPGDEVIIPAPFWVSYPEMITIAEATPILVKTNPTNHFKITAEELEKAITPKSKLLILNSPSNPTGNIYNKKELQALATVLLKYPNVLIVTDDIYEHIYWGSEPFCNIVMTCPELSDRTIVINGVSKAYAMTGWRLGYAAGPAEIINNMTTLQSQSTSNPCSITQAAATAALTGDQSFVTKMKQEFKRRYDYLFQALSSLPGFEIKPCHGAFYIFPNIEQAIKQLPNINNDVEFAELLIKEAKVAILPGSAFGYPGYVRFSYATTIDNLQQAVKQIAQVLGKK